MTKSLMDDSVLLKTGRMNDYNEKLTVDELAEAMYEGTRHVQNLAEKLARQHGKAGALTFFRLMGPAVQGFWRGVAQQLIDHSKEWLENQGSGCVLSEKELQRLKRLQVTEGNSCTDATTHASA